MAPAPSVGPPSPANTAIALPDPVSSYAWVIPHRRRRAPEGRAVPHPASGTGCSAASLTEPPRSPPAPRTGGVGDTDDDIPQPLHGRAAPRPPHPSSPLMPGAMILAGPADPHTSPPTDGLSQNGGKFEFGAKDRDVAPPPPRSYHGRGHFALHPTPLRLLSRHWLQVPSLLSRDGESYGREEVC